MTDQAIIAPNLDLFDQFQVLFAHFEKYFDVPAFAVQPYYFNMILALFPSGNRTRTLAFILAVPLFFFNLP
jgi:hypothetical protein